MKTNIFNILRKNGNKRCSLLLRLYSLKSEMKMIDFIIIIVTCISCFSISKANHMPYQTNYPSKIRLEIFSWDSVYLSTAFYFKSMAKTSLLSMNSLLHQSSGYIFLFLVAKEVSEPSWKQKVAKKWGPMITCSAETCQDKELFIQQWKENIVNLLRRRQKKIKK